MKAPWLAELKPGDVFYIISDDHVAHAVIPAWAMSKQTVVSSNSSGVWATAEEDGHDRKFNIHIEWTLWKPIRASPAAHTAYDALKRLWDDLNKD